MNFKVKVSSNNVRIVLLGIYAFKRNQLQKSGSLFILVRKNQSSFEQPINQKAGFLKLGMISTNRYNEGTWFLK